MYLRTLGRLGLEGQRFGREKLLILLAYLALEGPKNRKFLAELFWPDASDSMNSLAVALVKLKPLALAYSDANQVWVDLQCDALELQNLLRARQLQEGVELYGGAFADGLTLEDMGTELEEWIYATRERLAAEVRLALLALAERQAARGDLNQAAQYAEKAVGLPGNGELEPEELTRLYRLLLAADHPARLGLERTAKELSLSLSQDAQSVRGQLRQTLLGRQRPLEQLLSLRKGQVAWLSGGSGMGKTTLLYELEKRGWRYLPARSGLPFATLEPLLDKLEGGTEVILRRVAAGEANLLFDDWESMDSESQQVLQRLYRLRPEFCVVIAASGPPAFGDVQLELGPLSPQELASAPGAYEATDGIPSLVGSWLRSEPLEGALENRLNYLSRATLEVYCALALFDEPDLGLVRRALGLEAQVTAGALEKLLSSGLIEPSGRVRARQAAFNYIEANPILGSRVALALARNLGAVQSLPLYRRSSGLWEEADFAAVSKTYQVWGNELIRRGFPERAAKVLAEAPFSYEVVVLRAWALERSGQFDQALELVGDLTETPDVLAVKSRLYWRLGQPDEAKRAAEAVPDGNTAARAEALNVLGMVTSWSDKNHDLSEKYLQRSAALFLFLGRKKEWAEVRQNLLFILSKQGKVREADFSEALETANEDPILQARIKHNFGLFLQSRNNYKEAETLYIDSAYVAEEAGGYELAAWIWNSLGVLHHLRGQVKDAQISYERALSLAHEGGEHRLLGTVIANLAELKGDEAAWEEAIRMLEDAGYSTNAAAHRADLEAFRLSREPANT